MLRHYFQRKQHYAVPAGSLPDAGFCYVPVLKLLHHLVPVLRAPFYVPHAAPHVMVVPPQVYLRILHEITFIRLERDSYHYVSCGRAMLAGAAARLRLMVICIPEEIMLRQFIHRLKSVGFLPHD
jgi:hypothetical protein